MVRKANNDTNISDHNDSNNYYYYHYHCHKNKIKLILAPVSSYSNAGDGNNISKNKKLIIRRGVRNYFQTKLAKVMKKV